MAAKQKAAPGPDDSVVAIDSAERLFRLKVRAGEEVVARVRVTNPGKTALALDRAGTVALRRPDALARGVRKAFKEQTGDVIAKLIALGKQLEEEPALTAKISYAAAFDALQPGETREVEIRMRIPQDIQGEAGWTARLPLLGTTVAAELEIEPARPTNVPSPNKPPSRHRVRKGDDA